MDDIAHEEEKLVVLLGKLHRKEAQLKLLQETINNDELLHSRIISSIQPKIGMVFSAVDLQEKKDQVLSAARKEILTLAVEEKQKELQRLKGEFDTKKRALDDREQSNRNALASKLEKRSAKVAKEINNKMNRKMHFHLQNNTNTHKFTNTKRFARKKKQSKRRKKLNHTNYKKKVKEKRKTGIDELVERIKRENIVINLSNETIPNSAIIYLAKGLGFVQMNKVDTQDLKFDMLEFLRKVGWKAFFKDEDGDTEGIDISDIHADLRISSGKIAPIQNPLLDEVRTKLLGWVANHKPKTPKSNLTALELRGKKWITDKVKAKELFVTKADKGGATLVMNYNDVKEAIEKELHDGSKFEELNVDADKHRNELSKRVVGMVKNMGNQNILTARDKLLICGLNENDNLKLDPEYKAEPPYVYPLFKIHKLNQTQIEQKQIPPNRLVHASKFGPLYRMEKWCSPYLTQISRRLCKEEFLLDSGDLRKQIGEVNESEKFKDRNTNLFTLDVEKLYPSIEPRLALQAIEETLNEDTETEGRIKEALLKFIRFCFEEAYVQYGDKCYKGKKGIPTGGCNSRQIADIFLHWVLFKQGDFKVNTIPELDFWKRFIDDCTGTWIGTKRQFLNFVKRLNVETNKFGINFPISEAQFGKSVDFLDQTLYLDENNIIQYKSYSKPTDSKRYLNPHSFHPPHVFKSVPTSQMIRTMEGNSKEETREEEMLKLKANMVKSGYAEESLNQIERKVRQRENPQENDESVKRDVITFPISYFDGIDKLKEVVDGLKDDLNALMGDTRIIFATKKGRSIGNGVVRNKNLCFNTLDNGGNQKCYAPGCKQCPLVAERSNVMVNDLKVRIPTGLSCKTDNVIYLWTCNLCIRENAYFGRTIQQCNDRTSGHRRCFNDDDYLKSALSMHAKDKHSTQMDLKNFKISIVKKVSPQNIKREEFRFIEKYRTQTYGMNRYKTIR